MDRSVLTLWIPDQVRYDGEQILRCAQNTLIQLRLGNKLPSLRILLLHGRRGEQLFQNRMTGLIKRSLAASPPN